MREPSRYLLLFIISTFLILGGCVSSGLNPEEQALLRRVQSLEKQQSSWREQNSSDLRKMTADTRIRLDNLEREVKLLSQALEDSLTRPVEILPENDLGSRFTALENRILALEQQGKQPPRGAQAASSQEVPAVPPPPAPGAREQAFYNDAYATFKRGSLDDARAKFNKFIAAFPDSSYKVNALFWIGECDYKARDFAEAIIKYDEIISNYPKHPKAASAMLKQGFAFLEMGDPTDARIILQKVISSYPNSEQAEIARRKLDSGF